MEEILKVLDWFNPSITVSALKRSVVVYSSQKLMDCFEAFNPDLTLSQVREIIQQISDMKPDNPTTLKKKRKYRKIKKRKYKKRKK